VPEHEKVLETESKETQETEEDKISDKIEEQ
jgi:hypothetical protein